ncbi:hypothetical protein [Desulfoluna sp.]|uniref:hypothetical protein n=1 Tax=Desulfoluna sp. TaxID=2045199 RepID=UPI002627A847|nr:hypothetical protein [Desulfoluna sp.]
MIIQIDTEEISHMAHLERRFGFDRREPFERRLGYGLLHSTEEGVGESRCSLERRRSFERRFGWFRMGRWSSGCDKGPA